MRQRSRVIGHRAGIAPLNTIAAGFAWRLGEQNPALGVHDGPGLPARNGNRFFAIDRFWKGPRMSKLILVFAFVCTGMSWALAQGGHMGTPQEQKACSRDASRFCRKQMGDDGAVQYCLQQNRQRLSSACQKVFQSHGQ
jgi:hypothetical protein